MPRECSLSAIELFYAHGSCSDDGSIRQPVLLVQVSLYALVDASSGYLGCMLRLLTFSQPLSCFLV